MAVTKIELGRNAPIRSRVPRAWGPVEVRFADPYFLKWNRGLLGSFEQHPR
jgi:hypothetical protein